MLQTTNLLFQKPGDFVLLLALKKLSYYLNSNIFHYWQNHKDIHIFGQISILGRTRVTHVSHFIIVQSVLNLNLYVIAEFKNLTNITYASLIFYHYCNTTSDVPDVCATATVELVEIVVVVSGVVAGAVYHKLFER